MMTRKSWPFLTVALAARFFCLLCSLKLPLEAGQQAKGENKKPARLYYGMAACIQCHAQEKDYQFVDNPDRPPFVACSEIRKREPADKHVIAYQVLLGERAQRMGELLKHKIPDVKAAKECLSCHGVWLDSKTAPTARKGTLKLEEGVSCVACHGPNMPRNLTDPGWSFIHATTDTEQRDFWRKMSRARNAAVKLFVTESTKGNRVRHDRPMGPG